MGNNKHDKSIIERRKFVKTFAVGAGMLVSGISLTGCNTSSSTGCNTKQPENVLQPSPENTDTRSDASIKATFNHGIASGDPLSDRVILWTRVTPEKEGVIKVTWEIATDNAFSDVLYTASTTTTAKQDYTVKIDAFGLSPNSRYFYRFHCGENTSPIGRTKTLPVGSVDQVKLAVVSCSRYNAGYFHVYNEISQRDDLDALLHLGDYIYERTWSERAVQSSSSTAENPRLQSGQGHELLSLLDYRNEYSIYKQDPDLQAVHASLPFINVWDDHEIANDVWKFGAENHTPETQGNLDERKAVAIQAYFEWLPIREPQSGKRETVYRSFEFGNLVSLNMLDTRIVGRDEPLGYGSFLDASGNFDHTGFELAYNDQNRELLGATQKQWLQDKMAASTATWQVLGQQVMMGKLPLPAPLALNQYSYQEFYELRLRAEADPDSISTDEQLLLDSPTIPYSLQFWDGYANERENLLNDAISLDKNLVVLSADTHNAWANDLVSNNGTQAGVEFSTASVSSHGLESYRPWEDSQLLAEGLVEIIDNLKFCETEHRGYMVTTFTQAEVTNEWVLLNTTTEENYHLLNDSSPKVSAKPGMGNRSIKV